MQGTCGGMPLGLEDHNVEEDHEVKYLSRKKHQNPQWYSKKQTPKCAVKDTSLYDTHLKTWIMEETFMSFCLAYKTKELFVHPENA